MKNRKKTGGNYIIFPIIFNFMEPENGGLTQQMESLPPSFSWRAPWTYPLQFFDFALGGYPFSRRPRRKGGDLRPAGLTGCFIFSGWNKGMAMDQMEGFLLLWGEHHFHHFSLGNPRLGWVTFVTPDVNHGFTCWFTCWLWLARLGGSHMNLIRMYRKASGCVGNVCI